MRTLNHAVDADAVPSEVEITDFIAAIAAEARAHPYEEYPSCRIPVRGGPKLDFHTEWEYALERGL